MDSSACMQNYQNNWHFKYGSKWAESKVKNSKKKNFYFSVYVSTNMKWTTMKENRKEEVKSDVIIIRAGNTGITHCMVLPVAHLKVLGHHS